MSLDGRPVYVKHSIGKRSKPNDNDFLVWLRKQPSAVSGKHGCEACHYRTAHNAGMGVKPLYSAIPLTSFEHKEQHRIGQYNFLPREVWEAHVLYHLQKWLRQL